MLNIAQRIWGTKGEAVRFSVQKIVASAAIIGCIAIGGASTAMASVATSHKAVVTSQGCVVQRPTFCSVAFTAQQTSQMAQNPQTTRRVILSLGLPSRFETPLLLNVDRIYDAARKAVAMHKALFAAVAGHTVYLHFS
ncbi:MAG: hypothetical protein JWS12_618 [Candidatus Saccharibacteria bacterium]|nr:hypothetical protein [Candidatus Saccharibacteria bacterium]